MRFIRGFFKAIGILVLIVVILICIILFGGRKTEKSKPASSQSTENVTRSVTVSPSPKTETPKISQKPVVIETQKPEPAEEPSAEVAEEAQQEPEERTGIRPEFKEAMDSYEAFYAEYCELLKEYSENPTDLSLLMKYAEMMEKAEEMDRKFDEWDEEDMNDEETKYYLEVTLRIEKMLIDAM